MMEMKMIEHASEPPSRPVLLLVEDEPAVRRSLQLILQGDGFDVRSFGSAATLLADPSASSAIALVADYRLPDSDGLSILRDLKAAGFKGRAVLVTGYGSSHLSMNALAAGFSSILEKPFADRTVREALVGISR
ncbi:response regulator [Sphingomonas sp.]|uniref:response regulator n=1 Tax=Sphingomonas sp. TaxID=28214 RepID=UPI003B3A091D